MGLGNTMMVVSIPYVCGSPRGEGGVGPVVLASFSVTTVVPFRSDGIPPAASSTELPGRVHGVEGVHL